MLTFLISKIRLRRNLALSVQPSVDIPSIPNIPNLTISRGHATVNIFHCSYQNKPTDVSPVQPYGPLRPTHGQSYPALHPIPDIRDYPQYELSDDDPERELKRQENVQTTIDDALRLPYFSK